MQDIKKDFQEYKDKNDLDGYFERFLDNDSRSNILKMISDLMSNENQSNNWT